MRIRSVIIGDIDDLDPMWNDHINAAALCRCALREEMNVHEIDPTDLRDLLERSREQDHTKEETVNETHQYVDLKALVGFDGEWRGIQGEAMPKEKQIIDLKSTEQRYPLPEAGEGHQTEESHRPVEPDGDIGGREEP